MPLQDLQPFIYRRRVSLESNLWHYKTRHSRVEQDRFHLQYAACDSYTDSLYLKSDFIRKITSGTFDVKIKSMSWLWTLNSKSRDLDSRLGGYRICVINGIFFSRKIRISNEDLEDFFLKIDPQPDSVIQPKAWGLLHMEREYIAHHILKRRSGAWAPHSLDPTK